jgi:hypothetical protein
VNASFGRTTLERLRGAASHGSGGERASSILPAAGSLATVDIAGDSPNVPPRAAERDERLRRQTTRPR